MPEALAVFAVFTVAVVAWIGAWAQARDPRSYKPVEEAARLRQQMAWLEARLDLAERERWSADMIATLEAELNATLRELVAAEARERARK